METIDNELLFKEWLQTPIHPVIKESTLMNYLKANNKAAQFFTNTSYSLDIFSYSDLPQFAAFSRAIKAAPEYEKFNAAGKGSYGALLSKYKEYLTFISSTTTKPSQNHFIEWAIAKTKAINPQWVKNYIAAIKECPYQLHDPINYHNIFCIDDRDVFKSIVVKIKSDENFIAVNKSFKQGSFSAALGKYDAFLQSEFYASAKVLNIVKQSLEAGKVDFTEIEQLVRGRIGQSQFRKGLLIRDQHCVMCQLPYPDLLKASHIKPWAKSSDSERLDLNNGLLLCANHDALFDRALITFDENGKLVISHEIQQHHYGLLNLDEHFHLQLSDEAKHFFAHHFDNFQLKNKRT